MKHVHCAARAKINLSLDVIGKRPDGYHEMRMIMQSVSLCDTVTVALRDDGQISASSRLRYVPNDERNLAVRAAKLFFEVRGMTGLGADIALKKRIPVGSGLGGGSADAAATLRCLCKLTGEDLSEDELEELGARIGSDVPFCLRGGTALAEGRGERLTDLPPLPDCSILICKPTFPISTPFLFSELDKRGSHWHPDTEALVQSLREGDLPHVARRMYNVFEDALPRRCADITVIKSRLLDIGALGVCMTGTGSAVFGLFPHGFPGLDELRRGLSREFSSCHIAEPCGKNGPLE